MIHEVVMPKMSLTMEEGTIKRWLKKEGDMVSKGEILFELESDKTTLEIESEYNGILEKIIAPEEATLRVLQVIAHIQE
jgi:pyruvate/2-oxoglutarate dehydrogenase complex dihydrolipoamide acyltransferase (E2) component